MQNGVKGVREVRATNEGDLCRVGVKDAREAGVHAKSFF